MSVDALKTIGDECSKLFDLGHKLKRLAAAHYTVGNSVLGEKLYILGADTLASQKAINSATGQWVSSDIKRAGESSANLLKAALAGTVIAEEEMQ
jgi:hypothetical protein